MVKLVAGKVYSRDAAGAGKKRAGRREVSRVFDEYSDAYDGTVVSSLPGSYGNISHGYDGSHGGYSDSFEHDHHGHHLGKGGVKGGEEGGALGKTKSSLSKTPSTLNKVAGESYGESRARLLKGFDRAVRVRSGIMFALAIFAIAVMVAWGQTNGDGAANESIDLTAKYGVSHTALELAMSVLTFLHLVVLFDFYRFQAKKEKRSWFITDSSEWRAHRWMFFFLEAAIILPHPFPNVEVSWGRYLAVAMFPRLYTIFRILKVNNATYKERFIIQKNKAFRGAGGVQFSWLFSLRTLFITHSWTLTIAMVCYFILTLSYTMFVFERLPQSGAPWTFNMAVWNIVITATTVGYGDISAWSQEGRTVAGITGVIGVVLSSLLVYVIINTITPSPLEKHADACVHARYLNGLLKWHAVSLIQLRWRFWRAKRRGKGAVPKNFFERNAALKGILQGLRRQIALIPLDDIKVVEEISSAHENEEDQSIQARMERLREENEELKAAVRQITETQETILKLLKKTL